MGAAHLLASSHAQRRTLRDGKWRIAAAAATLGTTSAGRPQTWPPPGRGAAPHSCPSSSQHPRAGQGRGGLTFTTSSPLVCGAPYSGLGIVELERGRRWGLQTLGRGLEILSCCLSESVLRTSGKSVICTPASGNLDCPAIAGFVYAPHPSCDMHPHSWQ